MSLDKALQCLSDNPYFLDLHETTVEPLQRIDAKQECCSLETTGSIWDVEKPVVEIQPHPWLALNFNVLLVADLLQNLPDARQCSTMFNRRLRLGREPASRSAALI